MSLSNQMDQNGYPVENYKKYSLEPFDKLESPSSGEDESLSDFKAFFNKSGKQEEGFKCVPNDGRDRATEIVEKAKKDAEKLVMDAKNQKDSIEQEAYEKGYSQGEKDGQEMGAKKLDKILDKIHNLFEEMMSCRLEFRRLYEKETLDMICRIAERVVRVRVDLDHDVVREAILGAFDMAADRTNVTIRVNPKDIEYVKDLRPQFFERVADLKTVTMEADPGIDSGGCIMETAFGHVDALVDSQLEKVTTAVKEAFKTTHDEDLTEGES